LKVASEAVSPIESEQQKQVVCRHTRLLFVERHVPSMSSDGTDAESKVSGNQANIPARIRRELDIEDGDHLRWDVEDDGTLRVEVVRQDTRTFADFEGYDGETETNVTDEHDTWGVDCR